MRLFGGNWDFGDCMGVPVMWICQAWERIFLELPAGYIHVQRAQTLVLQSSTYSSGEGSNADILWSCRISGSFLDNISKLSTVDFLSNSNVKLSESK